MASEKSPPSDLEAALHSVVDDTADHIEVAAEPTEQLNADRIRQLTRLRRATIRSRSWCLIGAIVGFVAAAELVFKIVQNFRYGHGWGFLTAAFVFCAIASGLIAVLFFRRYVELHREIQTPILRDPATPPDFSTLSDGSQHWKNLEEMK
jgi:hypothetical protein